MEAIINHGLRFTSNLRSTTSLAMNNAFPTTRYLCCVNSRFWIFGSNENNDRYRNTLRSYFLYSRDHFLDQRISKANFNKYIALAYSTDPHKQPEDDSNIPLPNKQLSLLQRMKQLTKDYWYILLPVHLVTSIGWIGVFYALVTNGVDVTAMLEKCNFSEHYLEMLRNSGAGNWALAYALYKIFTPARYTVTIGGTTMVIRYLNRLGYLKVSSFKNAATKVEESQKSTTKYKTTYKIERQTQPPKT